MGGVFYVYEHWRPDKNEPFYVGKGKGSRSRYVPRGNRHHQFVLKKLERLGLKTEVLIVADNLAEEDAFNLEIRRIAFWRKLDVKLTNASDGGEGPSGFKHSEETKAKVSAAGRGRIFSKERRANISAANKGKKRGPQSEEHRAAISAGNKGKKFSKAVRQKISAAHLGKNQGPHTAEHRAKIGDALRGRKDSPKVRAAKKRAAQLRPPLSRSARKKISKTVAQLWSVNKDYRSKVEAAHAKRKPISASTRAKMAAAQQARRANTKVSKSTRSKVAASVKAWHASQGHKIA